MQYRPLGKTGLLVSTLCLGTMVFGENSRRGADRESATRLLHQFLEAGGNHVDTANVYAGGRSEEIVGVAIKDRRDQVILATKVRHAIGQNLNDQGLSRYNMIRSVEASLRRLQTDRIDLLIAHAWDPLTPLDETMRAFDDLVASGKVRYIGVSNFKAWQLMKALALSEAHGWMRFVAAQYQYSLVERNIEHEIIELCLQEGLGLTPWGPLGGGFLSGKYRPGDKPQEGRLAMMPDETEESWLRRSNQRNWDILQVVDEVARARQATPSQVALAWLLRQPAVCSVIVGARTPTQLDDNLAAGQLDLSEEELARLSQVSEPDEPYPYRFLKLYASRDLNPDR
ncbi:MAG TPA: aldo/keto reductase [Anaerolineales bacterium]|nr:aldo/keto reductase [Anaerolineales bacterium]